MPRRRIASSCPRWKPWMRFMSFRAKRDGTTWTSRLHSSCWRSGRGWAAGERAKGPASRHISLSLVAGIKPGASTVTQDDELYCAASAFGPSTTYTRFGFPGSILFFSKDALAPPQLAADRELRARPGLHQHHVV